MKTRGKKMKVIKDLGTCGKFQVKKIRWEDSDLENALPVLGIIRPGEFVDIRIWKGEEPRNGICLSDTEIVAFLLNMIKITPTATNTIRSGNCGGIDFFIHEEIATLRRIEPMELVFTKTCFKTNEKLCYDLRYWSADRKGFTYGASLSWEELLSLSSILTAYADENDLYIPDLADGNPESLMAGLLFALDYSYIIDKESISDLIEQIRRFSEGIEV